MHHHTTLRLVNGGKTSCELIAGPAGFALLLHQFFSFPLNCPFPSIPLSLSCLCFICWSEVTSMWYSFPVSILCWESPWWYCFPFPTDPLWMFNAVKYLYILRRMTASPSSWTIFSVSAKCVLFILVLLNNTYRCSVSKLRLKGSRFFLFLIICSM